MAGTGRDGVTEARILYWGIPGAGKTANLRTIHARLKASNRGELRQVPTRLDPTVAYEVLPIELGEVGGTRIRLQIVAAPGAREQAPTRKRLLDEVDGMVLVIDSQRDRIDANVEAFEELRQALAAYGRSLDELPVVVQYNKHDLADAVALEDLHRKLDVKGAAVFETVATEPGGPLRTLTTISKRIMRVLRDQPATATPPAPLDAPAPVAETPASVLEPRPTIVTEPVPAPAPEPAPAPAPAAAPARPAPRPEPRAEPSAVMESAILSEMNGDPEALAVDSATLEAQRALDRPWSELQEEASKESVRIGPDLRIVSVGTASLAGERSVRVPLVLGNDDGETVSFALTLQLDPLLDGDAS